MSNKGKILVKGIQCPRCNEKIASLYRHDFKYCGCGYCFIDGGQEDYIRIGWGVKPDLNIPLSPEGLYPPEEYDRMAVENSMIGRPKDVKFYITGMRIKKVDGFPGYEQTLLEAYKDVSKKQQRDRTQTRSKRTVTRGNKSTNKRATRRNSKA